MGTHSSLFPATIVVLAACVLGCSDQPPSGPIFKFWNKGAWGFIDKRGTVVHPAKYLRVTGMNGDAHVAQLPDESWVLVSATSETRLYPKPARWIVHLGDGIYRVGAPDEIPSTVFDTKGLFQPPDGFSVVSGSFRDGRIPVNYGQLDGYANREGEVVIAPEFETARTFMEGTAAVPQDGRWRYIDDVGGSTKFTPCKDFEGGDFEEGSL